MSLNPPLPGRELFCNSLSEGVGVGDRKSKMLPALLTAYSLPLVNHDHPS